MRQQTLGDVTALLKAELGFTLTTGVGTADDQRLYTLIDNKQNWFASEYDWPFLKKQFDVSLAVNARYGTLPAMNFERPILVEVFWNTFWKELQYGIDDSEYNVFSSGDQVAAQYVDPILRWQFYDETQFEVWPRPVSAFVTRFTGQRPITTLKSGSSYSTTALLDLDGMLIMYAVAADVLVQRKADALAAQSAAAKAAARFNSIRGAYPSRTRTINLAGRRGKIRQLVAIQIAAP